jgi:hypothetical protein
MKNVGEAQNATIRSSLAGDARGQHPPSPMTRKGLLLRRTVPEGAQDTDANQDE